MEQGRSKRAPQDVQGLLLPSTASSIQLGNAIWLLHFVIGSDFLLSCANLVDIQYIYFYLSLASSDTQASENDSDVTGKTSTVSPLFSSTFTPPTPTLNIYPVVIGPIRHIGVLVIMI
jgi:hypothetical protein